MKRALAEFFENEKIEYYAALDYRFVRVLREDMIDRLGFTPRSVIVFLVPYYSGEATNISVYAMSRDYHLYVKELEARLAKALEKGDKKCHFKCFSDHSPIDERDTAARLGLGIIGKNRLLINERYGSYVFIAEIITDIPPKELSQSEIGEAVKCSECGACIFACPTKSLSGGGECLSQITQKKGELSEEEKVLIFRTGMAWGCDACQKSCPHNLNPRISPIPFFLEKTVYGISLSSLEKMTKEEFSERAFSWRGKKTVERNLKILEKEDYAK